MRAIASRGNGTKTWQTCGMLPAMRSGMRLRTWVSPCVLVAGIALVAPRPALAEEATAANVAAARRHFEKARSYYGQGAYREAIAELEAAHVLDPAAKDLVFNLGVVHEKLADIDDALHWFRLYTTMDLTLQERERADAYIKRLEGARKEVEGIQTLPPKQPAPPPHNGNSRGQPELSPSSPPHSPERPPPGGRIDALTVDTFAATTVGLGFGVLMGALALHDKPTNLVKGQSSSEFYGAWSKAHNEAIAADVGFGVAAVGAIATVTLYFGRARVAAPSTTVSVAPVAGGGAFFVQRSF
jgi:tetratricopeptide (TPR) repeat protein